MSRREDFFARILCLIAIFALASSLVSLPALAQQAQPTPSVVDRSAGEAGAIEQREEWFFSTRRAGTSSPSEMSRLRYEGVVDTRLAIQAQRQQRGLAGPGGLGGQNLWVSKGPSPSTFGGWSFGNITGRISAAEMDWASGTLYVGTASGGVWKSTNQGQSYVSVFDDAGTMTVGAIAIDPDDPNVVWVGTGENNRGCESYFGIGLLRSPDGGASWELRNGTGANTLDDLASFANVLIDPRDSNRIVTGGRMKNCANGGEQDGGIYTTTDGGLNWTVRLANKEVHEIARDPDVLDTLWASADQGVYKSTDNGVTWIKDPVLPATGGRTELAIAPSDGQTVYVLYDSSFWQTTDGGANWTQKSSGSNACDGQCWYNMVIRVHSSNPTTVYRGTIRGYRSTNGGQSWSDLTGSWGSSQKVHQDLHVLLVNPADGGEFYIGGDGGLWRTPNGGANFVNANGNMNITQFYAVGTDASNPTEVICGGAQDNSSLVRSTSNVWDLQQVTGDGFVCHINPQNNNYAYITSYPWSGYPAVLRSTSGIHGSFQHVTGAGSGISSGRVNWVTPYLLDPTNPSRLYVGTQRIYRSDNNGSSWSAQGPSDMTGGSGSLYALDINRNSPDNLVTGSSSGRVWRTEDAGANWVDITSGLPGGRSINDVASDPTNPDRLFAVLSGFNTAHVWEWNDGQGWTERGTELPNVPANTVLMLSGSDMMVGMDTGVFRSVDGGVNFFPYMDGMPQGVVVTDLKLDLAYDLVTAGTYGRGAWQTTIGPVTAQVQFDSLESPLTEVDGDLDGNPEPGETLHVLPYLRNVGGQDALGVSARLTTSTPGVTIVEPSTASFGDLLPGAAALPAAPFVFYIDPTFPCGDEIVFDIVEITSTTDPFVFPDQLGAFTVQVIDTTTSPATVTILDEGFSAGAGSGWSRQVVGADDAGAGWTLAAGDGDPDDGVYLAGNRSAHARGGVAWLRHGGSDSGDGAGIRIPADARAARLEVVHRFGTNGARGGRVVIDDMVDGRDEYISLKPAGGYPDGSTFAGASDGWTTSWFDLSRYKGRQVWIAFVYESDDGPGTTTTGSGGQAVWEIDHVAAQILPVGSAVCQLTRWPGSVPATMQLGRIDANSLQATWSKSCNNLQLFGQRYSIQVGDLDALAGGGGVYTHAPNEGICNLTSPQTFTPGPGNEYYLIVPNSNGREGGRGLSSSGSPRPQIDATCGLDREAQCF